MTILRLIGSVDTIGVTVTRQYTCDIPVPDLISALRQRDSLAFALAGSIVDTQFHPLSVSREQREVDSGTVPVRSERVVVSCRHFKL